VADGKRAANSDRGVSEIGTETNKEVAAEDTEEDASER
jgi:hypothetical protein